MTAKSVRDPVKPVRKSPTSHDPEALRWARDAKRWTQAELAKAVGISPAYMSMIEAGDRSAPPRLLDKFAEVLNCPVSVLERKRDAA
jgi:transcriptional regulator with XRE-family HTH domain